MGAGGLRALLSSRRAGVGPVDPARREALWLEGGRTRKSRSGKVRAPAAVCGKNYGRRSHSRFAQGASEGVFASFLADLDLPGVVAPVLRRFRKALEAKAPLGLDAGCRA